MSETMKSNFFFDTGKKERMGHERRLVRQCKLRRWQQNGEEQRGLRACIVAALQLFAIARELTWILG